MARKIIALATSLGLLAIVGVVSAVISSYGSITGYAIVQQTISWDIIETGSDVNTSATNDTVYTLETAYQGETKWVKVKVKNAADVDMPVNISVGILPESAGGAQDVNLAVMNEGKNATLSNPITIPATDLYVWIKHEFASKANPGSYSFSISILPV